MTIEFPVAEYEMRERAIDDLYQVKWLGDNVAGITPGGSYLPMYRHGRLVPGPAERLSRPRFEGNASFR